MSLAPGTRLGPYEILSPLGAGGMREGETLRELLAEGRAFSELNVARGLK